MTCAPPVVTGLLQGCCRDVLTPCVLNKEYEAECAVILIIKNDCSFQGVLTLRACVSGDVAPGVRYKAVLGDWRRKCGEASLDHHCWCWSSEFSTYVFKISRGSKHFN